MEGLIPGLNPEDAAMRRANNTAKAEAENNEPIIEMTFASDRQATETNSGNSWTPEEVDTAEQAEKRDVNLLDQNELEMPEPEAEIHLASRDEDSNDLAA